eukprot:TRINITY_DN2068_c1_g2_i2.p1 TRINITY_DN2068_c1_g2~~TRINITY_DN2068_c1_g2_i2.p1  ORF type:complete len:420 (-),score=196.41 TRINITY_DN2068_c1_g2_i2:283-1431(-)
MGTEISTEDIESIKELCDQVIQLNEYREQLFEYLKNRMNAIAPNLTILIGELIGARLIAHAGSLLGLAKQPASTIQILGAEKALFRALKTRHSTPKYGLIYHASLIGQSAPKNKGKISRLLASKAALLARVDALNDAKEPSTEIGIANREKVEVRLRQLEGKATHVPGQQKKIEVYDPKRSISDPSFLRKTPAYNTQADSTLDSKKRKREEPEPKSNGNEMEEDEDEEEENEEEEETPKKVEKKEKKPEKKEGKKEGKKEEKKEGKKEGKKEEKKEEKKAEKKAEKKTPQKPKEESEEEDEEEEEEEKSEEEESEEEERPKKKVKVEKSTPKKSEKEEKKTKKAKKEKEGKKKSEKEDKSKKSQDKKEKKEKEGEKKKKGPK